MCTAFRGVRQVGSGENLEVDEEPLRGLGDMSPNRLVVSSCAEISCLRTD